VLKRHGAGSEFTPVATTARESQLDLLHYVIETQRRVNVLPSAATDRAVGIVLDRVQAATNAEGAGVEVAEGNVLMHRAVSGLHLHPEGSRTPMGDTLSGLSIRVGTPLVCQDSETDSRVDPDACRRAGIRAIAVAPMFRGGEALGVLQVLSGQAHRFEDADVDILELMANIMASSLSTTSKLEREAERALRDPLTGLPNRFIFMDRLAHHGHEASRYGRPYGLFLIGLDRFSVVNETLGREWGDAVLRSVAQGLHNTVRGGDTLARLESDQFVVLCGNAERAVVEERLKARIEGVVAEVDKDLRLDGYTLHTSVGVAWSAGNDVSAEDLIGEARASLQRAKDRN
jgi:diguanylate cyclase (GGDEF)-like protein